MRKTKLFVAIAAAAGLSWGAVAQAGVLTDVNVLNGAGTPIVNDATEFDWSSGSVGVADGALLSSLVIGQVIPFQYQSKLVAFNDASSDPITPLLSGLNAAFSSSGYEFTVVASITEIVLPTSSLPNQADFGVVSGSLSIFYDSTAKGGVQSNQATGLGYDDGQQILHVTLTGGASSFSATTGTGGTLFDFDASGIIDFVDANFIQGIDGPVFDLHFQASQNIPGDGTVIPPLFFGSNPTTANINGSTTDLYPTYNVVVGDLALKVDGSNTFTRVPEPSSLALLGLGLSGFGFGVARRRRS